MEAKCPDLRRRKAVKRQRASPLRESWRKCYEWGSKVRRLTTVGYILYMLLSKTINLNSQAFKIIV